MSDCDVEPYDLFVLLGLLVIEGRVPHVSSKGRREGPHCLSALGAESKHECDKRNFLCTRKEFLQHQMAVLWKNRIPMCIEVLLHPECDHGAEKCRMLGVSAPCSRSNSVLLEQWMIQNVPRRNLEGFLPPKTVFQAIKSFLHFSQLSSWLNSTGGKAPQNVAYRISPPADFCTSSFSQSPETHMFPTCASSKSTVLRVSVRSLTRQSSSINIPCIECQRSGNQPTAAFKQCRTETLSNRCQDLSSSEKNNNKMYELFEHEYPLISNNQLQSREKAGYTNAPDFSLTATSVQGIKSPCDEKENIIELDNSKLTDLNPAAAAVQRPLRMYYAPELAVSSPDFEDFHIKRGKYPTPLTESPKVLFTKNRVLPTYFDRKQILCEQLCFPHADSAEHGNSPDIDGFLQKTLATQTNPLTMQEMADQLSMVCGTPKQNEYGQIIQHSSEMCYKKIVPMPRRERRATEMTLVTPDDESLTGTVLKASHKADELQDIPILDRKNNSTSKLFEVNGQQVVAEVGKMSKLDFSKSKLVSVMNQMAVEKDVEDISAMLKAFGSAKMDDDVFNVDHVAVTKKGLIMSNGKENNIPSRQPVKFDLGEDCNEKVVENVSSQLQKVLNNDALHEMQANGHVQFSYSVKKAPHQTTKQSQENSGSIAELRGNHKSQSLLKNMMKKELIQNVQTKSLPCKVPTSAEQVAFQAALQKSANMIFHPTTGLPMQSSPAPLKKKSSGCFAYDSSLTSPRAIKSSVSCQSLDHQNQQQQAESELGDGRCYSTSAPASTNCLLGNFEESILNGRIDPVGIVDGFIAEIGASGLFCPQHLTLPVTAYFFSLSDDNAPSPYLGHVNLENNTKRGYHVPNKGTIQLTLFNPNKTVVKMFVVLYDLCDMPPKCQTFLRQRTVYMPVRGSPSDVANAPVFLRYLIHLRFASTKTGKIYLHTDIRLIFARDRFEYDSQVANYELRSFTECPSNPKFSPQR